MGSINWDTSGNNKKKSRAFPVFRFRRNPAVRGDGSLSPFTEIPEDLKHNKASFGRAIRGVFNFIFLLVLGVALLGLVGAFAYQMIFHPQVLWTWCSNLVSSVDSFIQALVASPK